MTPFLPIARRERLVRRAPLLVALAAFVGFLTRPITGADTGAEAVREGPIRIGGGPAPELPEAAYSSIMFATVLALLVIAGRVLPIRVRVHPYEATLPLRSLRVHLERMLGLWVTLVAAVLATWLAVALPVPDGIVPSLPAAGGGVMACTLFVLFVAGYRPWCPRLDGGEALLLGCAAGIAALVLGARAVDGLGMAHWVLAVAALWVAWRYATVFGIARTGRGASSGGGAPGTSVDDVGVRLVGPARWVLLRSVVVRPVFFWGCLLLSAFSTSGSAATLLIASTYFVFMSLHDGLGAIRALAPLPISPVRLFRTSTFPSFCVVVACHLLNARVRAVNWNSPSYQFLVESGHAADPAGVEPWSSLLLATLAWFLGCAVLLETLLAVHDSGQPRRGYRPRLSVGAIYACVVLVFLVVEFAGSSSAVMGAVQGAGALFGGSWVGWILLITALVWAADVALTRSFARIEVGTCLLDPWPGRPRPAR